MYNQIDLSANHAGRVFRYAQISRRVLHLHLWYDQIPGFMHHKLVVGVEEVNGNEVALPGNGWTGVALSFTTQYDLLTDGDNTIHGTLTGDDRGN